MNTLTVGRRPARRVFAALVAVAAVAMPLTPTSTRAADVIGSFDPVVTWPILPIHMSLLPDGRLMSYGTDTAGQQGGSWVYDVWTPSAGTGASSHSVLANSTHGDIFCSIQNVSPVTGKLLIFGGDNVTNGNTTNVGNNGLRVFDPITNTLTDATQQMQFPRWYASATTMPNGEVVIQGGSSPFVETPEVYNPGTATWRTLTGAASAGIYGKRAAYPHTWLAPNGKIFGVAGNEMYELDPIGIGSIRSLGLLSQAHWGWSTSVMYAPGKVMIIGGSDTTAVTLIDINGPTPVVTIGNRINHGRRDFAQATVLPNGKVLLSGGTANDSYNPADAVTVTEIFDPATGVWTDDATHVDPRYYHSGALLMPDGTVVVSGGGSPGPALYMNAEIYRPAYLQATVRPTFSTNLTVARFGRNYSLSVPRNVTISKVTLVRLGASTHGVNFEQRYVELSMTQSRRQVSVQFPTNANTLPPGYYMMTVVDQNGTPSVAKIINVKL